ncbi:MAG TPA: LLM class flavin-dependent oxidoreductase [Candidatus Binatia bacterium]|nr:LLM class flavin-dependent oxidoreductase [Candidatus Binatia bacterium]
MLKVIVQLYPVIAATDEDERRRLRPIGRNAARYQETLAGWHDIVRAADDLDVWGVATIEHHFHSEGYEVGPNPGVLNAYWAAITKNVRVGQLGYVMSTQNPIRVAEETAILDHLSRGRGFVGFARGYQSRWTDVLGQHLGGVAALSDGSPADRENRKLFEEQVDLVLRAWTEDSIEHRSGVWQIPYPYETGGREWPMVEWTRVLGAAGEIDGHGAIRRVSVVPAPFTRPHPPVFVSSNASLETIEWAGRHGFVPTYFSSIGRAVIYGPAYVSAAAAGGRGFALGENQAIVRWPRIGTSRKEGLEKLALYDGDIFKHFYGPFLSRIGGQAAVASDATRQDTVAPMLASGLFIAGGAADVRDEFVRQWRELPAEYAVLIYHYAQQPKESVIEDLRLFMREVKPALDEVLRSSWGVGREVATGVV